MGPYETLARLFDHLTPTTLAAIVDDLTDDNDQRATRGLALNALRNNVGNFDADRLIEAAAHPPRGS